MNVDAGSAGTRASAGPLRAALWLVGWLAGAAAATASTAPPAPPAAPVAPVALQPCRLPGLETPARCGVVVRPLDPERPAGPAIGVHFAVLPALARNKKPDPVLFFAGGPGQSAIDLAGHVHRLLGRIATRRDIVLVDQRGTGRSAPLFCGSESPARPLAEQLDVARQMEQLAACRAQLQALPHGDLRRYTTPLAIQDARAVLDRLGVQRANLVGASYGTRAALEFMREFPGQVRRVVLDGAAPPDMVLPASFSVDNQAALDAMFAACEADAVCARRHPGLRVRWQALLQSLPAAATVAHPLTARDETLVVTRETLLSLVRQPLYVPSLAAGLPAAIASATEGRFAPLVGLALALPGRRGQGGLAHGMHLSVVCAEDYPRLERAADAPAADFGSSFATLYRRVCPDWPRGELPLEFYRIGSAAAPTVVLSGGADPATPARHGERVVRALGEQARHVVVPQAGHGVMSLPCVRDALVRFIDAEDDDAARRVDFGCAARLPRPPAFVMPGPERQP